MQNCIFCKIVSKEIDADIILEDENFLAFKDINPIAPVHVLIISKKHYKDINEFDSSLNIISFIQKVIKKLELKEFRLVNNTGASAGQSVFHIHFHLLSGRSFSWPPG